VTSEHDQRDAGAGRLDPTASASAADLEGLGRLWPRRDRPVPADLLDPCAARTSGLARWSHQWLPTELLIGMDRLPFDLYVCYEGRMVLYARQGGDARRALLPARDGLALYVAAQDHLALRRILLRTLPTVLGEPGLPPAERGRTAYRLAAAVLAPLFRPRVQVGRDDLSAAELTGDLVTRQLAAEPELFWSLVAAMERSQAVYTHALNTAIYAVALAQRLAALGPAELLDLGRGALLHDVGKVRLPLSVLDKPGPLDEREWALMRQHPRLGYQLVSAASGRVPPYARAILEHHERADGSGYPSGLRAAETPLASRIVAIADAYDALTSVRSYKRAASPFEALYTMRFAMRGQFDDELLKAFIAVLGGASWQPRALDEPESAADDAA
jgi:putative nucleotidyltransferase with HDIG domain